MIQDARLADVKLESPLVTEEARWEDLQAEDFPPVDSYAGREQSLELKKEMSLAELTQQMRLVNHDVTSAELIEADFPDYSEFTQRFFRAA